MPWDVEKRGDEWVVLKQGTDRIMGRHKTEKQARAQQRALYANVKETADGYELIDGVTGDVVAFVAGEEPAFAVFDFLVNTTRMADADYSAEEMRKLGAKGQAFRKDNGEWAYPTPDLEHWGKALHAYGRSVPKERDRLKAYLKRRGADLGAPKEAIARISNFT